MARPAPAANGLASKHSDTKAQWIIQVHKIRVRRPCQQGAGQGDAAEPQTFHAERASKCVSGSWQCPTWPRHSAASYGTRKPLEPPLWPDILNSLGSRSLRAAGPDFLLRDWVALNSCLVSASNGAASSAPRRNQSHITNDALSRHRLAPLTNFILCFNSLCGFVDVGRKICVHTKRRQNVTRVTLQYRVIHISVLGDTASISN
jgi:hypothetical protein